MIVNKIRVTALVAGLVMLVGIASCSGAATQDLSGLITAIDGNEVVLTLDDGSTVKLKLEKDSPDPGAMLGKQALVKVKETKGAHELVEIERRGEDTHYAGTIVSTGSDTFVIGDKTIRVNAATLLDDGLLQGSPASVEGIVLSDGTILATKIESSTDGESSAGDDKGGTSGADSPSDMAPDDKGGTSGADSPSDMAPDDKGGTSGADSPSDMAPDDKGGASGGDSPTTTGVDDKGGASGNSGSGGGSS